jgi:hypothetical protein
MFNEKHRVVTITEEGFDPPGIPATMGHPVLVEFRNDSQHPHQIEFRLPGGPVRLLEPLAPGRRAFVQFISEDLGIFSFGCPEHEQLKGTLVVNAVM